MNRTVCREIITRLLEIPCPTKETVNKIKMDVSREFHVSLPKNSEIIKFLTLEEKNSLVPLLRLKPIRTISGVNVITVMTQPWPCPKTEPCIYCPGGPASGTPQSYTGREPAALRGLQHRFNPYAQIKSRIRQLRAIGHEVSKVELIVLGGTFTSLSPDYQRHFVKRCLDALNTFETSSLIDAKKLAANSKIRNVGISVETRPDWLTETQLNTITSLGVTRVELGVQTIYNNVYKLIKRGHTVQDVVKATRMLKDSGFKVVYHLMPNLFTSHRMDLDMFKHVFKDESFKPDAIKIYPTLVLEGTMLHKLWCEGKYNPSTQDQIIDLLVEVKRIIPKWIRIQRIQRDIPSNQIIAGVKASNLRQLVQHRLKQKGLKCRCIRCREAGHRLVRDGVRPDPVETKIVDVRETASEGEDVFISLEDLVNDVLIGYLRLRIPSEKAHRPEVASESCSIVRELHIFGPMVPVGEHRTNAWQHTGCGGRLLSKAERLSIEEYDRRKIVILSALGTKEYYAKFGYKRDGLYMTKWLH